MKRPTKNVNGVDVPLTDEEIKEYNKKNDKWAKEAKERERAFIARQRKKEYPDIGDQLDALLKYFDNEMTVKEQTALAGVISKWKEVKERYPKIEE